MCAEPTGFHNGATVVQQTCAGRLSQTWLQIPASGRFLLKNEATGKCMDVTDGNSGDRASIQQWDCAVVKGQIWYTSVLFGDYRRIVSGFDKCLDVAGGSLAELAPIQQYRCTTNNPAQSWELRIA